MKCPARRWRVTAGRDIQGDIGELHERSGYLSSLLGHSVWIEHEFLRRAFVKLMVALRCFF